MHVLKVPISEINYDHLKLSKRFLNLSNNILSTEGDAASIRIESFSSWYLTFRQNA